MELVRGAFEAANRRDVDALMAFYAPDGLVDTTRTVGVAPRGRAAVVPEMRGVFRGKEAVRRWWREWLGAWETVEFEYELLDAGNRVVALIDQRMRRRSIGIEVSRGKYAQVGCYGTG